MTDHRDSEDTTPSHAEPDRFCPSDALESLYAAILRVNTLAQVANGAVNERHYPVDDGARRAFVRMQILVGKAADEASMALAEGDKIMAALTKHLQARRAERELGERRDVPARPALTRRQPRSSPRARSRGARQQ